MKLLSYYHWNNRFNITDYYSQMKVSDVNNLYKPLMNFKAEDTVSENDTVFFHESSKIPRFKFNNYCSDKKIRRVINLDKASAVVVNTDIIKAFASVFTRGSRNRYYEIPFSKIKDLNGIKGTLGDDNETILISEFDLKKTGGFKLPFDVTNYPIDEYITVYGHKKDASLDIDQIIKIVNSSVKKIDDKTLNKQIGGEMLIINKDNFDEFNSMLSSKDVQIVRTGLELLANSNYEESKFYISLLLNSNQTSVNQLMGSSVNLRNLVDYFKDIAWYSNQSLFLRTLRVNLIKEGALTQEQDNYIHKCMIQYANNALSHCGIEVKEIVFK